MAAGQSTVQRLKKFYCGKIMWNHYTDSGNLQENRLYTQRSRGSFRPRWVMKFKAAAINMNIHIGGGLEYGGHSKEETSKQNLILCEIIKILINIISLLRRL